LQATTAGLRKDRSRTLAAFSFLSGPQQEHFDGTENPGCDGSKELMHTAIFKKKIEDK
jgi:hypothetical protein